MRTKHLIPGLVVAAALLSTRAARADFNGQFTGLYAPANWTTAVSGNATYDTTEQIINNNGPLQNLGIYGAVGPGTTGNAPSSEVDFSITMPGTGAENISFIYAFFNPSGLSGNTAFLFDNNTLEATLTSPTVSTVTMNGVFHGGDKLDFRVISVNSNFADVLEITPVPEPSTIALMVLGGAALLFQMFLRRKSAKI